VPGYVECTHVVIHNILYHSWEGTFASPKIQQVRSLKNTLWVFICRSKPGPQSWDDFGTRHREILPTPKLNSSDSQVSWGGIFCYPSTGEGHSCLVQECYVFMSMCQEYLLYLVKHNILTPKAIQWPNFGLCCSRHVVVR
jgi:hypothetical protein